MISDFRVVIFSSAEPARIHRLVTRLHAEAPGVRVAGILAGCPPRASTGARSVAFVRSVVRPGGPANAAVRLAGAARARLMAVGAAMLDLVHGARPPRESPMTLERIAREAGVAVHITADYHAGDALAFVRSLVPHLGLIYGTGILKPVLFEIPTHGSINIHKRKLPDYRGGGPVGLWELLDGRDEIGVTVHQVTEKLDAGHVVNAATIRVEPFDTLTSLALKAQVVGHDLLVRSVTQFATGTVRLSPQQAPGRMFRTPSPARLARYGRELARRRPGYRARRSRPVVKLLAKTLLAIPLVIARNGRARRRAAFPVTILFHHVVADRPHRMGIATEHFLRHVRFLQRHYRVVSLSEAVVLLRSGRVDVPTVVLTFDDGYADNFLTLRAIVEETGVPMTMFVSTGHMSDGQDFAHDRRAGEPGFAPLTWDEVTQLHREGFEIGSHTRTHYDCGSRDRARLEAEIVGSCRELAERLGSPVRLFSFPGGLPRNISPEAGVLAATTYDHVFTAFGGANFPGCDLRHLKRAFHASHLWDLELQIQGVLEQEPAFAYPRDTPPVPAVTVERAVLETKA